MSNLSGPLSHELKKDDILCLEGEGESDHDLYFIHRGELLICVLKGSQVTPLAYLEQGEYFGEMSFFDRRPRSATVIATQDCELVRIPVNELEKQFPLWLYTLATSICTKIRHVDELIRVKGIKKQNVKGIRPLDMKEQTHYFQLIKKAKAKRAN
ncbi:MAG: cyclic nucleotide-binding domain-containing protein [Bdellovibrionota bacterium]